MAMAVNIGEYHDNNNCKGLGGIFQVHRQKNTPGRIYEFRINLFMCKQIAYINKHKRFGFNRKMLFSLNINKYFVYVQIYVN